MFLEIFLLLLCTCTIYYILILLFFYFSFLFLLFSSLTNSFVITSTLFLSFPFLLLPNSPQRISLSPSHLDKVISFSVFCISSKQILAILPSLPFLPIFFFIPKLSTSLSPLSYLFVISSN